MKTKTRRGYVALLLLSILAQGFSAYFGKKAAGQLPAFSLTLAFVNPNYIASLVCLGVQFLAWMSVLKRLPLFRAYLIMSLVYPLILFIGIVFFGERIRFTNIGGMILIMSGVVLIGTRSVEKS